MANRLSVTSELCEKKLWQIEFENEPVNDARWSCMVAAAVEEKSEDEEFLKMFNQDILSGKNVLIETITMSDLIKTLKNGRSSAEVKDKRDDKKSSVKLKEEQVGMLPPPPPPRFSEVVAFVSKHANYAEGQCKLPPEMMAYALKYMILHKKDKNCFQRRLDNAMKRKRREAELRETIINKIKAKTGIPEETKNYGERVSGRESLKYGSSTNDDFDIFADASGPGPYQGPDMYIVLLDFYNPVCLIEMQKIKIPFVALIKIGSFIPREIGMRNVAINGGGLKKSEVIDAFWKELESQIAEGKTTELYKDIVILRYVLSRTLNSVPGAANGFNAVEELAKILYSAFHIYRLHQCYLEQMIVHRMIECLEPLELERCEIYNNLCDILVMDDINAELFVLYAIIEQVVAGLPETACRINEYAQESTDLFLFGRDVKSVDSEEMFERNSAGDEEDQREHYCEAFASGKYEEPSFTPYFFTEFLNRENDSFRCQKNNPTLYFYDDLISLGLSHVDDRILKPNSIFDRFLINPVKFRILNKFPQLTKAERNFNDFQYSRIWEKSQEDKELLLTKVFFMITMKLIEHTKSCVIGNEAEDSSTAENPTEKINFGGSEERYLETRDEEVFARLNSRDVTGLFYARTSNFEKAYSNAEPSVAQAFALRKAKASAVLATVTSDSFDNEDICCKSPGIGLENGADDNSDHAAVAKKIQWLLESREISYFNEPALLARQSEFEQFIGSYNFFEKLEPNRMCQRIERTIASFNTIQYNYFSPTDTLFILAYNNVDHRGVAQQLEKGFVTSPVSLRDFFHYVLSENEKWMMEENENYINFLKDNHQKISTEEQRIDHDYKCNLLKMYHAMITQEKNQFLGVVQNGSDEISKKPSKTDKKKKEDDRRRTQDKSTEKVNKMGKVEDSKAEEMPITMDDLEELPIKLKQPVPNEPRFHGINMGSVRTEVNIRNNQFHSKDGSLVIVKTETWLYHSSVLTLIIRRLDSRFFLHKWKDEQISKIKCHFVGSSGILCNIFEGNSFAGAEQQFRFFCTITMPNGLIIEPLSLAASGKSYVKQSYLEIYRRQESMGSEKYRCCLPNGQVLIFRNNATLDILCASGTKYGCYKFTEPERKKKTPCSVQQVAKVKRNENSALTYDEPLPNLEIEIYDVLTPTGELWVRDECLKCKRLVKTMTVLIGVDGRTNEIFYRREDGTNCMLWPDGTLVTTYPDGTKITCTPTFEEEEICVEDDGEISVGKTRSVNQGRRNSENDETRSDALQHSASYLGSAAFSDRPTVSFAEDRATSSSDIDGFCTVKCSYLLEHPNYATISFNGTELEIKMPQNMSVNITPEGTYTISSGNSGLAVLLDSIEFYQYCGRCRKKSTSTIYLDPAGEPGSVICKTEDYYDQTFIVYDTGDVLHKTLGEDLNPEYSETSSKSQDGNKSESDPLTLLGEGVEPCDHQNSRNSTEKCLILERDLTGIEFIHQRDIFEYIANLSENAYYDVNRFTNNKENLQHSFFDPIYAIGRQRWIMKYQTDNSHPTNMTRSSLIPLKESGCPPFLDARKTLTARTISSGESKKKQFAKGQITPDAVIARFIRVLHSEPTEIFRQVNTAFSLYQTRAMEISQIFRTRMKKNHEQPFARYVARQLQLIASALCHSLDLYSHTCSIVPFTESDIHFIGHKLDMNETIAEVNPADLRANITAQCKQIPRTLGHGDTSERIPEGDQ